MLFFNFPCFIKLSKKGVECAAAKVGKPKPKIPAKGAYYLKKLNDFYKVSLKTPKNASPSSSKTIPNV
jgi:hypothetical protein